jgi:transposase
VTSTGPAVAPMPSSGLTRSISPSTAPGFRRSTRSPKGIRSWQQELLAYFEEPTTNGYAEGVINKVKVIKRRAYGLPTFSGFRKRVVIACG